LYSSRSKIEGQPHNISELSSKDLETKLREPLDILGYNTGKVESPETLFHFKVTDSSGLPIINIFQLRTAPLRIDIILRMEFTQELQNKLSGLNDKDRDLLSRELMRT